MAGKRIASSELNHDNWDEDYETEEAGTFKRAPEEVLSRRVIKTARRRNPLAAGESGRSTAHVFSNFGGFTKPAAPTASSSPFAFLSNVTSTAQSNTNGLSTSTSATNANASTTNSSSLFKLSNNNSTSIDKSPEKSSAYLNKLQGLNESVSAWIKTHVDKNPYCILTPIFKDYEKHLAEIDKLKEIDQKTPSDTTVTFKLPTSAEPKISQASSHSASIFGKSVSKENENPFLSKPADEVEEKSKENASVSLPTTRGFTFGSTKLPTTLPTSGFSFGSGTPFTFSNVTKPETDDKKTEEAKDDDEEPPKPDFTPVVEEDHIFTKRCKVFVMKDSEFGDRGVGQLFLKPVENQKVQLIVRQDTSLGNLLLNLILSKSIPIQRKGKNNVMLVCIPDEKSKPPPVPVVLRVKTAEEADELLSILEKHQK